MGPKPAPPQNGHLLEVTRTAGKRHEGSYIVRLKDGVDKAGHLKWLKERLSTTSRITHDYPVEFSNSFAGKFDEETLRVLRASDEVERISEDAIGEIFAVTAVQNDASWGLNRISQRQKLPFKYTYNPSASGGLVDIYIMGECRVLEAGKMGLGRLGSSYDHGHGTKVAGIAAGSQWGVAKEANIIAVKTHSKNGEAYVSDVKAAMAWIFKEYEGLWPAVVNMSFGYNPVEPEVDEGVAKLTGKGIHVCVAAGNTGIDAKDVSPARCPSANTVGGTDPEDRRFNTSNYGSVVTLFAPGACVKTATIGSNTALTQFSGTSAACPHESRETTPAKMTELLRESAIKDILSDIPPGTPNLLANNGN
ncbi:subtilisin-like protein [Trametes cingulata]|nr:subtilisin-like protein [Trametes cingulata]